MPLNKWGNYVKALSLFFALILAMTGVAWADWQQSYAAYQQALAAGNGIEAKRHAREAWEQGREALAPSDNLAALAQNYVTIAMFSDEPEDGLVAAEEAIGLAEQGFGVANYDLPTLVFFEKYIRSAAAPGNRRAANSAYSASADVPERLVLASHPALAFRLLALRLLELGVGDRSFEMMTRLIDQEFEQIPVNKTKLQEDLSLRMFGAITELPAQVNDTTNIQSTIGRGEAIDRIEVTIRDWRRHSRFYPLQETIDSFDEGLATSMASERLVSAFYRSFASNTRVDPFIEALPAGHFGVARNLRCEPVDWTRNNLRFPATASGYNGALLIGFHLTPEGRVEGVRVLSEIPGERFGDAAVRAISRWRANVEGVDPACLRDRLTSVEFYNRR